MMMMMMMMMMTVYYDVSQNSSFAGTDDFHVFFCTLFLKLYFSLPLFDEFIFFFHSNIEKQKRKTKRREGETIGNNIKLTDGCEVGCLEGCDDGCVEG